MKSFLLNNFLPSVFIVLVATTVAVAQSENPGSGGPLPGPTAVPIDGGVSLLLAGGVAYGLKHLRSRRRKV